MKTPATQGKTDGAPRVSEVATVGESGKRKTPGNLAEAGVPLTAPSDSTGRRASAMMVPPLAAPVMGARRTTPEPTLAEWRARCLLAQSLVSHRLDTDNPDVAAVLAVLRGDLSLAGAQ